MLTAWCDVLQAAGFVILVAGTLVYAQGDRKQEAESKHEDNGPVEAATHEAKKAVFKFHHTITSHPQRNLRERRWRRAINATLAATHLRPDEENGANA